MENFVDDIQLDSEAAAELSEDEPPAAHRERHNGSEYLEIFASLHFCL